MREWVGNGLKAIGEMLEAEEESEPGERADVVREIFVSPRSRLHLAEHPSILLLLTTKGPSRVQNVLKNSLLSADATDDEVYPPPTVEDLVDRYGSLFAQALLDRWDSGGRDIFEEVSGAHGADDEDEPNAMEE